MKSTIVFLLAVLVGASVAQFDANCHTYNVKAAKLDQYGPSTGGDAVYFDDASVPGGKQRYQFVADQGTLTYNGDNMIISGTLVPSDGSKAQFFDAHFVFKRAAAGTPKLELKDNAYVPQGPVDPKSFQFFTLDGANSHLVGHGAAEGMTVKLSEYMGMPLQTGKGANGKNVNFGASGWFAFEFIGKTPFKSAQVVDINIDIGSCAECATNTLIAKDAGGQALFVSSSNLSPFNGNNRFNILDNSANFVTLDNGDLSFDGRFAAQGSKTPVMTCKMLFHPTTKGMAKRELDASAYIPAGSVDPNTWTFYSVDASASSCSYAGNTIKITGDKDMPLQLGKGANGKNTDFGASVWLAYTATLADGTVVNVPDAIFDINVSLDCGNPPTVPPTVAPTVPPTVAPTTGTTVPPTNPPTNPPTSPPTNPPTQTPTIAPSTTGVPCTWMCVPNGQTTSTGIVGGAGSQTTMYSPTTVVGGTFPPRASSTGLVGGNGNNTATVSQASMAMVAGLSLIALVLVQ
eukprot:gene13325-15666_t